MSCAHARREIRRARLLVGHEIMIESMQSLVPELDVCKDQDGL